MKSVKKMRGEIDKDFYCVLLLNGSECKHSIKESHLCDNIKKCTCKFLRHKWPTREQYKKEYGREYPLDAAVYYLWSIYYAGTKWECGTLGTPAGVLREKLPKDKIVCACTPFGAPPQDWRPKTKGRGRA